MLYTSKIIVCPDCKRERVACYRILKLVKNGGVSRCAGCNAKKLPLRGKNNQFKKGTVPHNKGKTDYIARKRYKKRWRENNLERVRLYFRDYYSKNKDRDKTKRLAYSQTRRRAGYVKVSWVNELFAKQSKCYLCNGPLIKPEIDHIVPVSLGGKSEPCNLALACQSCNRRKWANSKESFLEAIKKTY